MSQEIEKVEEVVEFSPYVTFDVVEEYEEAGDIYYRKVPFTFDITLFILCFYKAERVAGEWATLVGLERKTTGEPIEVVVAMKRKEFESFIKKILKTLPKPIYLESCTDEELFAEIYRRGFDIKTDGED